MAGCQLDKRYSLCGYYLAVERSEMLMNNAEMKKMLPIGIENFPDLITGKYYYVDKTLLIQELLENLSKVTLFTRPRRFGKSLNMSMLQSFFEIGIDPTLFDGLYISRETALCDEHMGKYPVISISLKSMDGKDFDEAYSMCATTLQSEARRFKDTVRQSTILDDDDKSQYNALLAEELSTDKVRNSLWLLSSLLYKHYGRKVIILIDEYDVPLAKAYERGYYDQMVILIRGLFERTLKTNNNMFFAVLTGCMRVAKESIFTGLNNLEVQSVTGSAFNEFFGFSDAEVKKMLAYYGLDDHYDSIKAWYDGYLFGDEYIYCPWSALKYVKELRSNPKQQPINYWANTSGNDIIRKLLNIATPTTKRDIERLIAGEILTKKIYPEMTYAEIDQSIDHIWSLLFTTGYLTCEPFENGSVSNVVKLKIPNEEVCTTFEEQIVQWCNDRVQLDPKRYTEFIQAFGDADVQKINEMFNGYLRETISIRDTFVKEETKENFYHGFLLAILNFSGEWEVSSNVEAGDGFSDIQLSYVHKPVGIVIELKYGKSGNLDADCTAAMNQIEDKHYTDGLKEKGYTHIYKYGIACYKKQCKVVMEKEIVE